MINMMMMMMMTMHLMMMMMAMMMIIIGTANVHGYTELQQRDDDDYDIIVELN